MQNMRILNGSYVGYDMGLRSHMLNVYGLVALGLAISTAVGFGVGRTEMLETFYHVDHGHVTYTGLGIIAMLSTFGALLVAAFGRWRRVAFPAVVMHALYWLFTTSMGVTLAALFADSSLDLMHPLLATTITFSGLCILGYTTKRDLTGLGTFSMVGLFGLVAMGLIGMFTGMHLPMVVEGALGVLVFIGLTAYDAQQIKVRYIADRDSSTRVAVWDAMGLYLDAINLFIRFVQIFNGNSRD